ncbi:MAG TPA: PQQ-dependent sugar dehydrogenase [Acidimicrobiia bacterium]|nr:PQQ-dependent sugar dehydrogenase [Acidimicrobiia bacterium]
MRRTALVLTTLASVLVLVGGCASDDESDADPSSAPSTTATTSPGTSTTTSVPAGLAEVSVAVERVASGLERPIAFAVRAGDPALYIAEQPGRVRRAHDGTVDPEPVLDLTGDITDAGNEQGLLGLAFSPAGDRLYLDFTDTAGDTRVQEFAVRDDGSVDPSTRRELLTVAQPFSNHNGGHLAFGPDGMLYIALGDGGSGGDPQGNAQDLSTLLGKILRIDPTPGDGAAYTIPADNPFVGTAGARGEIWMYGLRNPWRFSFDRATGDLWIGDVGQNAWEEIDFAADGDQAGVNWGWNAREGAHYYLDVDALDPRDPIYEYDHDNGRAVTGGFVYRGAAIPALRGVYVFADFAAGALIGLVERDGQLVDQRPLGVEVAEVASFGEDAAGELYVVSRAGDVFRLIAG